MKREIGGCDDPARPAFLLRPRALGEGTELLEVVGVADMYAGPEFRQTLMRVVDSGKTRIVVDLSAATLVDSTMLGAMVGAARRLRAIDGGLAVVCRDTDVRRLFEVTGLDQVFPLEMGVPEAIQALGVARPGR